MYKYGFIMIFRYKATTINLKINVIELTITKYREYMTKFQSLVYINVQLISCQAKYHEP